MNTGESWIRDRILCSRMGDKPGLTEEAYIKFVLSNIVTSPLIPEIVNGFVTEGGDVIGYTSECSGNIHYVLASIYCGKESENPLLTMDWDLRAIKITSERSLKLPFPEGYTIITEFQIKPWLQILEGTKRRVFNLGWGEDNWYTLHQIYQMDRFMLNKHLTT